VRVRREILGNEQAPTHHFVKNQTSAFMQEAMSGYLYLNLKSYKSNQNSPQNAQYQLSEKEKG
jgi:hypothetical protein